VSLEEAPENVPGCGAVVFWQLEQPLVQRTLGVYNDKQNPANVADQFKYMLSYTRTLPKHLPDFYNYLLNYPHGICQGSGNPQKQDEHSGEGRRIAA